MNNLIVSSAFSFMTAIAAPSFAGEIEDYTGLPLNETGGVTSPQAHIIDEQRVGYDGLPVTRRTYPEFRYAEAEYREGYDGLPLVESIERGVLAVQASPCR